MSKSESAAFVKSVDSLFGQDITSDNCPWFSDRPPLVLGAKNDKRALKSLKQKCRLGLPPQLRCAIWISSVERIVNPHLPIAETDSYGTVGMKKNVEAKWDYALNAVFPNPSDREDAIPPDLGLQQEVLNQLIQHDYKEWNTSTSNQSTDVGVDAIPKKGANSLALVLCTVQQVLGIEYCPPLPDVASILLTHMPESYVFATIREMINDTSHFLPVSQKDYYSWCKTYAFFVKRMFPKAYKVMDKCGALDPQGLEPIFKRFFTTILKREDVLRFMDIFLVEGCKAIFRMAFSLVQLVRHDLKPLILTDSESFWNEIRYRTLDPTFSFKNHLDAMYPKFGKVARRYPKRRVLRRVMKFNEKWALENMPIYIDETPPKPIGFTSDKCTLAKPVSVRSNLAKWLPPSLKATKLDLIYSTEIHGRSLASFYEKCQRSKNTIVLIEALTGSTSATIGMFASHAWNINSSSYGDGECFLFRANPDPKCFNWAPDFNGNMDDMENQVVREQFMVARRNFIAMGANKDGTNGLRLDQDLVEGESHPALGFENEPLPGGNHKVFDVGVLEVYRLIREVDGKAIGDDDNLVW
eukprot:CAMPEP_0201884890 /NCGR_PEP_ID=MMETSP0902-20130614/17606_1 /ASSEMBLY_ACC=CAM_ASM_000551 /TAXON_ID=420261 /ORGANISM="Thalassiosira antarctica, Strain CCMP982" /LENGTH=581 /DNA_ID=CAMNT_0048413905 /DNA_START=117 /DNA_END=1859 /DNA_ORIENTATION=-